MYLMSSKFIDVEELLPANANILDIGMFNGVFDENKPYMIEMRAFYLILPRRTSKQPVVQVYRLERFIRFEQKQISAERN